MSIIYGIGYGEYSSADTACVFPQGTTEEPAQAAVDRANEGRSYDKYYLEEFELMDPADVKRSDVLTISALISPSGEITQAPLETTQSEVTVFSFQLQRVEAVRSYWLREPRITLMASSPDHEWARKVFADRLAVLQTDDAMRAAILGGERW